MILESVKVSAFRSFAGSAHHMPVGPGLTCLVGPNNSGKSNILDAIGIALHGGAHWEDPSTHAYVNPRLDFPKFADGAATKEFRVELILTTTARPDSRAPSRDRTLLRRALDYERSANRQFNRRGTHAAQGRIVLTTLVRVRAGTVTRHEYLGVPGLGRKKPTASDSPYPPEGSREHDRLFDLLHEHVRLVKIRSGESLDSVLQGPFREVLEGVIEDHLREDLDRAKEARNHYAEHVRQSLLRPLSDDIAAMTGQLFPEMSSADLLPAIPSLQDTLSSMSVQLRDAMESDIRAKGTGVRAGVLVAVLRYLAAQSHRSLVLAVEEPESFLHPAAQELMRESLVGLAASRDTSVLVTSHSPFMIPDLDAKEGRVVGISKAPDGRSSIHSDSRRDHAGFLFRDAGVSRLLATAQSVDRHAAFVVITEGQTDIDYMRIAARIAGREDLLDRVQFVAAAGATKLPAIAVLMSQSTSKPVLALLDSDQMGKRSAKILHNFHTQPNRIVLRYGQAPLDRKLAVREAEDVWPRALTTAMAADLVNLPKALLKQQAPKWVESQATAADCMGWVTVQEWLHERAGGVGRVRPSVAALAT